MYVQVCYKHVPISVPGDYITPGGESEIFLLAESSKLPKIVVLPLSRQSRTTISHSGQLFLVVRLSDEGIPLIHVRYIDAVIETARARARSRVVAGTGLRVTSETESWNPE